MILKSKPQIDILKIPQNGLRMHFYYLSKNWAFELLIVSCIVLNMLLMAVAYEGASETYMDSLEKANFAFTLVFCAEALVKITGVGIRPYFRSRWNRFDFSVVMASLADLAIGYFYHSEQSFLRIGPQLARVFRVLRVSRLFRIFKALKSLEDLIAIISHSITAILNVFSLSLLIYFIYAILGVFLFHKVGAGQILDEYSNFHNFGMAMTVLFRVSTGEEWHFIMYDCQRSVNKYIVILFFVSFVVITMFVMLNLFIMVIVQIYEDYEKDPKNSLQLFTADVLSFKKVWEVLSEKPYRVLIHYKRLPDFVWALGEQDLSLGVHKTVAFSKVVKILTTMDIHIDPEGFIYYNDLLHAVLKRKHVKNSKDISTKHIMKREDAQTVKKLIHMAMSVRAQLQRQQGAQKSCAGEHVITNMIFLRIVFRSWSHWADKRRAQGSSGAITPRSPGCEYPGANSLELSS